MRLLLIKLGGSVITNKGEYGAFNTRTARRLLEEIADRKEHYDGLIIVHGAGSFGHILAKESGIQNGLHDDAMVPYVSRIQYDCRRLNLYILDLMIELGMNPVSLPPSAMVWKEQPGIEDDSGFTMDMEIVKHYISLGMVPVSFGDVVPDHSAGMSILSGDDLMLKFSRELHPDMAIFVSDVDGLYDRWPDGNLIESLSRDVLEDLERTSGLTADVTGAIYRKAELGLKMASLGVRTVIINGTVPGRLAEVIEGKKTRGTWFY